MPTRSNLGAKDFELISAVLAESLILNDDKIDLALAFADRLVSTSDSFDPMRFIGAVAGATLVDTDEVTGFSTALRLRVEALEARRSPR